MPERYQAARPCLYHLTAKENLAYIRETRKIYPAATLMETAGRPDLLRQRRRSHERFTIGNIEIVVRDQAPLYRGNVSFEDGFTFESFIEHLNRRVFFWPGTTKGPISYGIRHFRRYEGESPAILRVSVQSLLMANPSLQPLYCGYNSGSPRCSYGTKSPRGTSTFAFAADFDGTPSTVVEVTFPEPVTLPADTQYGGKPTGPWRSLLT